MSQNNAIRPDSHEGTIVGVHGIGMVQVPYSASITFDASLGNLFRITIADGVGHTINAPLAPTVGQEIAIMLRNASGGVAGTTTWNAIFKMTAWANGANGNSRCIYFIYDGTNWVEIGRAAADVPN